MKDYFKCEGAKMKTMRFRRIRGGFIEGILPSSSTRNVSGDSAAYAAASLKAMKSIMELNTSAKRFRRIRGGFIEGVGAEPGGQFFKREIPPHTRRLH